MNKKNRLTNKNNKNKRGNKPLGKFQKKLNKYYISKPEQLEKEEDEKQVSDEELSYESCPFNTGINFNNGINYIKEISNIL
jgi:hypothetical protein